MKDWGTPQFITSHFSFFSFQYSILFLFPVKNDNLKMVDLVLKCCFNTVLKLLQLFCHIHTYIYVFPVIMFRDYVHSGKVEIGKQYKTVSFNSKPLYDEYELINAY